MKRAALIALVMIALTACSDRSNPTAPSYRPDPSAKIMLPPKR